VSPPLQTLCGVQASPQGAWLCLGFAPSPGASHNTHVDPQSRPALFSTAASWGFTPCFRKIRDANKVQMLPSIKYPDLGGRTAGTRRGDVTRCHWEHRSSNDAHLDRDEMPWGGRCHQRGPSCPRSVLAHPTPRPRLRQRCRAPRGPPSRFCLAAWAIFSCL